MSCGCSALTHYFDCRGIPWHSKLLSVAPACLSFLAICTSTTQAPALLNCRSELCMQRNQVVKQVFFQIISSSFPFLLFLCQKNFGQRFDICHGVLLVTMQKHVYLADMRCYSCGVFIMSISACLRQNDARMKTYALCKSTPSEQACSEHHDYGGLT